MPDILAIKCKQVNLSIISENLLLRWTKGVSLMLEKLAANANAQKLRAILLLEVDFNALHKIIFNNRLVLSAEMKEGIPMEVIRGRRSQLAAYLA